MKVYWHTGEKSLSVKPNHFSYTHHQPVASPALVYLILAAKDSSASRISVIKDEELNDVCVVASCLWSINLWHQDYFGCDTDAHVQRRMLHLHWLVAGGDNWVESWGTHIPADACPSVICWEEGAGHMCKRLLIFKGCPCYLSSVGLLLVKKEVYFVSCLVTFLAEMKGPNCINPIKTLARLCAICLKHNTCLDEQPTAA